FLDAPKWNVFWSFCRFIAQLNERLPPHLRITQVRNKPSDLAYAAIFAGMPVLANFGNGKAHRRPQLLKVLANFVDCDPTLLRRVPTQLESKFALFPEDPFQSIRQRFAQFQFETHRILYLLVGESHVAVTFFAGYFSSKPGRRREFSAAYAVGKFHFRHHETGVSALINVNLND